MLKEALATKEAYKQYIEGAWKSEPLEKQIEILKKISPYMSKQCIDPYYEECINQLETKQHILLKQRLAEPIPETLTGEVYTVAIHSDPYRSRSTYDIKELYIPYYGLNLNTSGGFHVFLDGSHDRHESPPIKTIEIPAEMAMRIYAATKELAERDELKKYVEGIIAEVPVEK